MEFAFEKDAMQGQPLPKGLDIADSCLYVALKNLYAMYRNRRTSNIYGAVYFCGAKEG